MLRRYHECCAGAGRAPFSLTGSGRNYERSLPFALEHLDLDLKVRFESESVDGVATWTFRRRDPGARQLTLDAVGFVIRKVELRDGGAWVAAPFEYDSESLVIAVGQRCQHAQVRVRYQAQPRRGLYFLGPDAQYPKRPKQVWSQCQDEDARHWFPCHDKPHIKSTLTLRATVPSQYSALSNGVLEKETKSTKTKTRTFTYRMAQRLPSYLVTLVVGQFARVSDRPAKLESGREVPVEYWVPKGREQDAKRGFARTPEMIELFSRLTGVEYPYARYTQVVVSEFIFGGMENTTATTMYEHVLLDERASLDIESYDLVAHELAHQWFGDWVTCKDWAHAWLNEGFATYFEHLEREDREGHDEYLAGVERDVQTYLGETSSRYSRAIVSQDYDTPIDLFDRHLYEKGGLVLHLLRTTLGPQIFDAGIRRYLQAHPQGNVTTPDLRAALEQESGRSLDRLFDEFVYRAGHPNIKARVEWAHGHLTVKFEQLQKGNYELHFRAVVRDGSGKDHELQRVCSDRHCALSLKLDKRPSHVVIDPELQLIGRLRIEAPTDLLEHQLQHATSARGRRQAAQLLGKKRGYQLPKRLARVLQLKREAWTVRAACARSLASLRGREAFDLLVAQREVEHPKVRHAVAEALGRFRTPEACSALSVMLRGEKSDLVRSAIVRALGQTRQESAAQLLRRQVSTSSWGDVVSAAALTGLATLRQADDESVVRDHTDYGKPTRVRRSAVIALAKMTEGRQVREHLELLLDDPHPHLRSDVAAALQTLGDPACRAALERRLGVEDDGRVSRRIRETLRGLDQGDAKADLTDRLSRLEQQLGDALARLATLESRQGTSRDVSNAETSKKPSDTANDAPPQAAPKQNRSKKTASKKTKKKA